MQELETELWVMITSDFRTTRGNKEAWGLASFRHRRATIKMISCCLTEKHNTMSSFLIGNILGLMKWSLSCCCNHIIVRKGYSQLSPYIRGPDAVEGVCQLDTSDDRKQFMGQHFMIQGRKRQNQKMYHVTQWKQSLTTLRLSVRGL